METFEFQGKNTEDAIENACRKLNLTRDDIEIEVIEPGSAGIFGLVGGRKARIRVIVSAKEPQPLEKFGPGTVEEIEEDKYAESEQMVEPIFEDKIGANIESPEDKNGLIVAKDALEKILNLIPVEGASVTASQMDGIISLYIEGDKSGLLIGRKGRTLDALQFVVNKIVNKTLEKRTHVVIDSESYRQRRKEFLTQMALQMGSKAKKIKKPVVTNLLYPHDRRIVHLALKDDNELSTKSRGEGLFKKVIIIPKG
ncbi:R3H domain protein [uncultured Desulfobacterium sp.]|uniref:RNA-binding protein KhpB n=1 Tax=uncultured Desulfobacterium sp. TaxID=201089 RepID=A0A445N392_9BACT|nr:R3H domain protein [uncultured Desulfobacterium sp.]